MFIPELSSSTDYNNTVSVSQKNRDSPFAHPSLLTFGPSRCFSDSNYASSRQQKDSFQKRFPRPPHNGEIMDKLYPTHHLTASTFMTPAHVNRNEGLIIMDNGDSPGHQTARKAILPEKEHPVQNGRHVISR